MANTLDLDPEWGALDLIEEVEDTFGIKVADEEAERCATVGDLYDVISAHSPDWDTQAGKCASSMTFYRLRRSLTQGRPKSDVSPQTPLLNGSLTAFELFKSLKNETGLRLPSPELTKPGRVGCYLLFGSLIVGVVMLFVGQWMVSVLSAPVLALGLLLIRRDPGSLPRGIQTVGDLARRSAPLNSEILKDSGGRPADRWTVLVALAAEHGELLPEEIGPETFFHRKSLEEAVAG